MSINLDLLVGNLKELTESQQNAIKRIVEIILKSKGGTMKSFESETLIWDFERIFKKPLKNKRVKNFFNEFVLQIELPKSIKGRELHDFAYSVTDRHFSTLTEICVEETGYTIHKAIHEFVMNEAYEEITGTSKDFLEISFSLGYSVYTQFCRDIKKYFGKTASTLRKEHS